MPIIKQMVRDAFIPVLAAPAVAEAGDINTGITLLKRSVVSYLNEHHPAPKEVIAPYLGKSVRWLYRMMEPAEVVEEDPQSERLKKLIFLRMRRDEPDYVPIAELHAYLRRCRLRYRRYILEELLSFYVSLGFIEQHPEDKSLFRATDRLTETNARHFKERKSHLEANIGATYPIAESYLRGQSGAQVELMEAQIPRAQLAEAAQEIQDQVHNILARYSNKGDGPKVSFKALVLCAAEDS